MTSQDYEKRQLTVFAERCGTLAERVAAGQLRLIDAADMLQSAAEIVGLVDMVGEDRVQAIMASAFTGRRA